MPILSRESIVTFCDNAFLLCLSPPICNTPAFFLSFNISPSLRLSKSVLTPNKIDGDIISPNDDILQENVTKPEFISACRMGFLGLQGKVSGTPIIPSYRFLEKHPELVPEFTQAMLGSSYFVSFHEYGHVLLGHIEMVHTPALEVELTWRVLGLSILINIFEVMPNLSTRKNSAK